jgi:ABC-2 type transport system ATP-binding protein
MKNVLEVRNISKRFRQNKKNIIAVNDVSFEIKEGEIFGLLGPNGAGKTTMLNMIVGILVPDSGSINVFGKDIGKNRELLEKMSLTTGGSQFHGNLKVRDILNFYGRVYGIEKEERERRIKRLVQFFGLVKFYDRKFWYLSTGEKMRLVFAKSLLNHPKLLLLDEPTLGLDPDIAIKMRNEIKRINRKFGTTILVTSHYMHEIEQLCDRIGFMNDGMLIDIGSIEKVKMRHFSSYEIIIKVRQVLNRGALIRMGFRIDGQKIRRKIDENASLSEILSELARNKIEIVSIETKKPSLEDYFVKMLGNRGRKNNEGI